MLDVEDPAAGELLEEIPDLDLDDPTVLLEPEDLASSAFGEVGSFDVSQSAARELTGELDRMMEALPPAVPVISVAQARALLHRRSSSGAPGG
jgi:hypothetical protein